ncbi:hypothetical protein JTE90_018947 [Oedothorax gibbosus]|uniref:Uncharacterized protein n=1 Tax=Oedothorax gibbosus TaxID=931172 RepID=A0AAV6TJN9_9ARAC|nr:hypothetical protein JTE90_018947 [Oedothorax gibbosus]
MDWCVVNQRSRVLPFIGPIFVWRDEQFNLHMCPWSGKEPKCDCHDKLENFIHSGIPLLLILVHESKTYLLYMKTCLLGYKYTFGNILEMYITLHKSFCIRGQGCGTQESDECVRYLPCLDQYHHTSLKAAKFEDLDHVTNCPKTSYCDCTKELLSKGIYKLNGIAIGDDWKKKGKSKHINITFRFTRDTKKEVEQWPEMKPYDSKHLKHAIRCIVGRAYFIEFTNGGFRGTFGFEYGTYNHLYLNTSPKLLSKLCLETLHENKVFIPPRVIQILERIGLNICPTCHQDCELE